MANIRIILSLAWMLLMSSCQNELSEPYEKLLNDRQSPAKVLDLIGVKTGMTIGEIGSGRGRYTVFLSERAGRKGKVYANDIDESSLAFLRGRCQRLNLKNVETITGESDNAMFPANSLDLAIMVLVYHMIEKPDDLLLNLKNSLKPGARLIIIDPHDELIDKEFNTDRSKSGSPNIHERIQNSAHAAGYVLVRVDSSLPQDYIFILEPGSSVYEESAGHLLHRSFLQDTTEDSDKTNDVIKNDTSKGDLSEKAFAIRAYEFLGARSYSKAIDILNKGIEKFPKSSRLYGELGEVYLITGERENARISYRHYLENGPDSLSAGAIMQNFDSMYELMRKQY